jgi:hypothetical protein
MLNGVGTAGKKVVTRVTPLDQSGSTRQWEHERVVDVLGLTDGGDRNEATARILSLYVIGSKSPDGNLEIAIRLHKLATRLRAGAQRHRPQFGLRNVAPALERSSAL